jgi:hypothetical protein
MGKGEQVPGISNGLIDGNAEGISGLVTGAL